MDPKTKPQSKPRKQIRKNHPEKIVYEYDMTMKMTVQLKDKPELEATPTTDHMFIGHEDSKEKRAWTRSEEIYFLLF